MPKKRGGVGTGLSGTGTPPPRVNPRVVDQVLDFLVTSYEIKRPPVLSAELLALVVELHRARAPYPDRKRLAKHLNCSPFGLDAAIQRAIQRGLISVVVDTTDGVSQRGTTIQQHKRYVPAPALIEAATATATSPARRRAA